MKALVATTATQGSHPRDFTSCIAGELVWMLDPCPTSVANPDGRCACGRSFSGFSSDGTTTTAVVRDIPGFTRDDYEVALRASFEALGWCSCRTRRSVPAAVDSLMRLAAAWADGTVVSRRLDVITARRR